MKTSQRLWFYLIQQNAKKHQRLLGKYQTVGRLSASSRRYLSTLQQPAYETSVASDGIVKSPYPDIVIPNLTVDQYVWQNLDKWADFEALVSISYGVIICNLSRKNSCLGWILPWLNFPLRRYRYIYGLEKDALLADTYLLSREYKYPQCS